MHHQHGVDAERRARRASEHKVGFLGTIYDTLYRSDDMF